MMTDDEGRHSGRVALVTGSTSGIGEAIAHQLAGEGFSVAFHSRSSAERGRQLADRYADASYHRADLSDQQQAAGLISDVLTVHGRLDVLVNNAGINAMIPHHNMRAASADIWRELYEVNTIAPWTLITEAEQALRASSSAEQPSAVLNVSSHAGSRPKGASIPYAASKAALSHMTRLLAVSLAPDIRVNAVAPGLVNTPMTESWEGAQRLWRERAPMGRGASSGEIAELVSMLINSSYLTGEVVLVDGGMNLT